MFWKNGPRQRSSQELTLKTPGQGVDFHMHTQASDGMWTPAQLVDTALAQGLDTFAVSDHDTFKNFRPVQTLAARHGMRVIPGVEITIRWKNQIYHMLSYNFNPDDPELNALLADTQTQAETKKDGIVAGLRRQGYHLTRLDEFKHADGSYLPVDIARTLYKGGEVRTFEAAIEACRPYGLDYIPAQPADLALQTVVAAGGVPVIAHPGRAEHAFSIATTAILQELVGLGLAGVEVYHYSHRPEDIERYRDFAHQHGLVISAGSDSHNDARKPTPWNPELVRGLLERFGWTGPSRQDDLMQKKPG